MPWRQMLTSKPLLSSLFLKTCSGFGYFLLMTKMPSYLSSVFHIEIFKNGIFSAGMTLSQGLCALLAAPLSNWVISKFQLRSMSVRKVFQMIAMYLPCLSFGLIPSLDSSSTAVIVLLLSAMFFYGFFTGGEWSTGSEYAPNSAGIVFGISNCLAFAMGVIAPLVVGIMLDADAGQSRSQWNIIFYITAAIYAIGPIPFLFFGTDQQQKWDKELENEKVDNNKYEEI